MPSGCQPVTDLAGARERDRHEARRGLAAHGESPEFPRRSEPRYASSVSNVAFDIPEETLLALKLDERSASAELRLVAAVKVYELGRLSSGAAAKLAGVPRVVFLAKLGELGASALRQTEAELAEDLAHA